MRRLQIYIDEPLDDMLAVQAHRQHRSKAALIREAVAGYFGEPGGSPDADPLDAWIGGTLEGAPGDIDDVVYGSAREPASPPAAPKLRP